MHLSSQFFFFFSFLDGEHSNNTYLLNLIFEVFALLLFVCLALLECACYHYKFNLLLNYTEFVISRLAAPWNLVPTGRFFIRPRGWDDGATIHWRVYWRGRSWQIENLLFFAFLLSYSKDVFLKFLNTQFPFQNFLHHSCF